MNMTIRRVMLELNVSIKAQEARMTRTPIPFYLASEHKHQSINARMTRMFLAYKHTRHTKDPSHAK
jgi:hypothetical protein